MPSAAEPPRPSLPDLLAAALPFLRDEPDPALQPLLALLRAAGAGECWHKHGTFLAHLAAVHRILALWRAPLPLSLCGLFHSAYSNSFVNLAIFPPSPASRASLRLALGPAAERLVHLFCVVPRHRLLHNLLLSRYPEREIAEHLAACDDPSRRGVEEPWRRKIGSLAPPGGIAVEHIHTGEEVVVPRRIVAAFLLMTMADFSEQLFGFQDRLFENEDGRLEFAGNDVAGGIWPGDGRPGLWMNYVSRMGGIYKLIVREEEICNSGKDGDGDEELELVIPPVFENCSRILYAEEGMRARDLYWEVVCGRGEEWEREREGKLRESLERNPYAGEAHVVLAQVLVGMGRWEEGEREGERGLRLLLEWGCGWDKRVSWEGWVAWARVLVLKAREREWVRDAWGVVNLGLVK